MTFGLNKLLGNAQIPMMCTEEFVVTPDKYLERARFLLPPAFAITAPKEDWGCVSQDIAPRHAQRAWESREWFANCQFWSAQ